MPMPWTDQTQPTTTWSENGASSISIGTPIGLLLALTYATTITVSASWTDTSAVSNSWTGAGSISNSWGNTVNPTTTWS
jgi:hypothetical protein